MDWYAAHYAFDPAAGNVFGREALRLRRDPQLAAWLQAGGRLSDYIYTAPALLSRVTPLAC
jgi:hypothetical protein